MKRDRTIPLISISTAEASLKDSCTFSRSPSEQAFHKADTIESSCEEKNETMKQRLSRTIQRNKRAGEARLGKGKTEGAKLSKKNVTRTGEKISVAD
jgi:hypothetical protein